METFKKTFIVAHSNWCRWKNDYRAWIILIFVSIIIVTGLQGYVDYGMSEGRKMTFCLLPLFFESSGISLASQKILIYIAFLLLVSGAPFMYEHVPYVIMRSGRKCWWKGECLYILELAFGYMLFLMFVSILCVLPVVSFSNDWGDIPYDYLTGSDRYTYEELMQNYPLNIGFPGRVVSGLYPFFSQLYAFFMGTWSFVILGLTTYFLNLSGGKKRLGTIAAAVLILLDPILTSLAPPDRYWLRYLSPVCWSSVESTKYLGHRYVIGLEVVVPASLAITIILILLIRWRTNKVDLYGTMEEEA